MYHAMIRHKTKCETNSNSNNPKIIKINNNNSTVGNSTRFSLKVGAPRTTKEVHFGDIFC